MRARACVRVLLHTVVALKSLYCEYDMIQGDVYLMLTDRELDEEGQMGR